MRQRERDGGRKTPSGGLASLTLSLLSSDGGGDGDGRRSSLRGFRRP